MNAKRKKGDDRPIDYETRAAMLRPVPLAHVQWKRRAANTEENLVTFSSVDQSIEGSFPASDPPPWTPGVARPAPAAPPSTTTTDHRVASLARRALQKIAALL